MSARRSYQVRVCKEKQQNSQMFPQSAQWHLCQVNSVVKKEKPVNSTTADMEALLCFFFNSWNIQQVNGNVL